MELLNKIQIYKLFQIKQTIVKKNMDQNQRKTKLNDCCFNKKKMRVWCGNQGGDRKKTRIRKEKVIAS